MDWFSVCDMYLGRHTFLLINLWFEWFPFVTFGKILTGSFCYQASLTHKQMEEKETSGENSNSIFGNDIYLSKQSYHMHGHYIKFVCVILLINKHFYLLKQYCLTNSCWYKLKFLFLDLFDKLIPFIFKAIYNLTNFGDHRALLFYTPRLEYMGNLGKDPRSPLNKKKSKK